MKSNTQANYYEIYKYYSIKPHVIYDISFTSPMSEVREGRFV